MATTSDKKDFKRTTSPSSSEPQTDVDVSGVRSTESPVQNARVRDSKYAKWRVKTPPKERMPSRSFKKGRLVSESLLRSKAQELGEQDAKREILADRKESAPNSPAGNPFPSIKDVELSAPIYSGFQTEVKLSGMNFLNGLTDDNSEYVTWLWFLFMAMFAAISVFSMVIGAIICLIAMSYTSTIYNWYRKYHARNVRKESVTYIGKYEREETSDDRMAQDKIIYDKLQYPAALIVVRVKTDNIYVRPYFIKSDNVVDADCVISATLFAYIVKNAWTPHLADDLLWDRICSAVRSSCGINLTSADGSFAYQTAQVAHMYFRHLKSKSLVDFPMSQGSSVRSSMATALEKLNCQKFQHQRSELELLCASLQTVFNGVLYKLLWVFKLLGRATLTLTPMTYDQFTSLSSNAWGVFLSTLLSITACVILSGVTYENGVEKMFVLLMFMILSLFLTGWIGRTTRSGGNASLGRYMQTWIFLVIVLVFVTPVSSASLKTNATEPSSTLGPFTHEWTNSKLESDPFLRSSKMNSIAIRPSLSMSQCLIEPLTCAISWIEELRLFISQLTTPLSNLTLISDFWKSVSSKCTNILPEIMRLQETLYSFIQRLYQDLIGANSKTLQPSFRQAECRAKCQPPVATDSPTTWYSVSSDVFWGWITSWMQSSKEMIVSEESRNGNTCPAGSAKSIGSELVGRYVINLNRHPIVQFFIDLLNTILFTILMLAYYLLMSCLWCINYLASMLRSNFIGTFPEQDFAQWFSTNMSELWSLSPSRN